MTRVIQPKGFLSLPVAELADESGVQPPMYVRADVVEGEGAAGFNRIEFKNAVVGLNAVSAAATGTGRLFSAQFASGEGIFTSLRLVNTTAAERLLILRWVAEDGSLLAEPAQITLKARAAFEKEAREIFTDLDDRELFVGSLEVLGGGAGVIGDVLFGDPKEVRFAAALPLQGRGFLKAVFSQVANGLGLFTGVKLFNPGDVAATVRIQVFTEEGVKTGERTLSLDAGAAVSQLLSELVPSTSGQVLGYIVLESDQPLIAQQVFGDYSLEFLSAVPPKVLR